MQHRRSMFNCNDQTWEAYVSKIELPVVVQHNISAYAYNFINNYYNQFPIYTLYFYLMNIWWYANIVNVNLIGFAVVSSRFSNNKNKISLKSLSF